MKNLNFALRVFNILWILLFLIVNKDRAGLDNMVNNTNQILGNSRYRCIKKRYGFDAYYILRNMRLFESKEFRNDDDQ